MVFATLSWLWTMFMGMFAPWIGFVTVLYVVATKLILPNVSLLDIDQRLANRYIAKGSAMLGSTLIAVKDDDGIWTLRAAEYDPSNNGYWVDTGEGEDFFSAEGVGGDPGRWYGGTNLAVAYDGLASLAAPVSGEIGRQVEIKKRKSRDDFPGVVPATKELLGRHFGDDPDPLADGGEVVETEPVEDVGAWEVTLPEKKVVDMRDTLPNAPFNIDPSLIHRVRQNAREGQSKFGRMGPYGYMGSMLAAAMLGGILVYMGTSGGGGGGVSVGPVLPGLLAPWGV